MADLIQNNLVLEERLEKHGTWLYNLENLNIPHNVSQAVDEIVTDVVDWAMQALLRDRFRDLPTVDMKEILQQQMFEDDSYKAHTIHNDLYEALQKTLELDYFNQRLADQEEARKKRTKETDFQEILMCVSTFTTTISTSSSRHVWCSRMIPSRKEQNKSDVANNWAFALATTYDPLAENHIACKDWRYDNFLEMKLYIDRHDSLSRQKDVRTHMRILSVVRIKAYSRYGYDYLSKIVLRRADFQEHTIAEKDFKNMYPSDFEDLNLLLLQAGEDFQLGIESYQTQLNLTKPGWDATGYEFKHDYTIIESPRAVVFPVDNNDQKIIRFIEIYKFSDGTLTHILEALDYRVKEFKVKRLNPGMNMRFWTQKDVTRSKEFIAAIERRLKTRRIFQNLECFVGGCVRDIDYRILQRTE
ncbi:hypothetical protein Tco_0144397 [Tanacetum coccineum]